MDYFGSLLADAAKASAPLIPVPGPSSLRPWVISHSDASGTLGFAGTIGPLMLHGEFDKEAIAGLPILTLEAYPVAVIGAEFGDLLGHCIWQPRLDNISVVFSLLKGYSGEAEAMAYLAAALAPQTNHGGLVLPGWEPREGNEFMDGGSKAKGEAAALEVARQYAVPRHQ